MADNFIFTQDGTRLSKGNVVKRGEVEPVLHGTPSCETNHHKYVGKCPYCHKILPKKKPLR